jgi:hypothetical protein
MVAGLACSFASACAAKHASCTQTGVDEQDIHHSSLHWGDFAYLRNTTAVSVTWSGGTTHSPRNTWVMLAVVQGPRTLSCRHKKMHAGVSGFRVPCRELSGGGAAGPGGDGAAGEPGRQRSGRPAGRRPGGRSAAAPRARAPRRLARARRRPAQHAVRQRRLQGAPARSGKRVHETGGVLEHPTGCMLAALRLPPMQPMRVAHPRRPCTEPGC